MLRLRREALLGGGPGHPLCWAERPFLLADQAPPCSRLQPEAWKVGGQRSGKRLMLVWGLGSLEPGVLVEDQQPCPQTVLSRHDDRPQVPTRPCPRRNLYMGGPRTIPSWGGAEIGYFFQNREKSRPSSEQGEGQAPGRAAGWGAVGAPERPGPSLRHDSHLTRLLLL